MAFMADFAAHLHLERNFERGNCDCCCNPGDRIVYNPPNEESQRGTFSVKRKNTSCFSCFCCISTRGKSAAEREVDRRTWQAFVESIESEYGEVEARVALAARFANTESTELNVDTFYSVQAVAVEALRLREPTEREFKRAKFISAFQSVKRDVDSPDSDRSLDFELESLESLEVPNELYLQDENGTVERFDKNMMISKLKNKPIVRKSDRAPLRECDIQRICALVIQDLLRETANKPLTSLPLSSLRERIIRYLKAADFDVEIPDYYGEIAPTVLQIANRAIAYEKLSVDEYRVFRRLAEAQIIESESNSDHSVTRSSREYGAEVDFLEDDLPIAEDPEPRVVTSVTHPTELAVPSSV